MLRMVIAEGRNLIRQRDEIERQAHAVLTDNADYQRLRQLPGVGPIIAMAIVAEAGDLRRFRHHRQFLKFCGLDLATHQSGQFPRANQAVEVRQRAFAPRLLDGGTSCHPTA